jgi:hypothetical protein
MYSGDLVLPGVGESTDVVGEEGRGRKISPQRARNTQRRKRKSDAESAEGAEKSGFLLSGRWYLLVSHGGGKFHLGDKVEIVKAPASEGGRYKGERGGPPEGGRYTE